MHVAVALLRVSEGLDYGTAIEEVQELNKNKSQNAIPTNQSFSQLSQGTFIEQFIRYTNSKNISVPNYYLDCRLTFKNYLSKLYFGITGCSSSSRNFSLYLAAAQ